MIYVDHYEGGVLALGDYKVVHFSFEPNQDACFINYRPQDCTASLINNITKEVIPCKHEVIYINQTNAMILKLEINDYNSKAQVPFAAMSYIRGRSNLLYVLADPYQDFSIKYYTKATSQDVPYRENQRISIFVPSIYQRSFKLSCNTSGMAKANIRYVDIKKYKDVTQNLIYTESYISENEMYGFVIELEIKDIPDENSFIKFQNLNSPADNYYKGRANLSIFQTGSYGDNLYISEFEDSFNRIKSMCLCSESECLLTECPNSLPMYNIDKLKSIIDYDNSFTSCDINIYVMGTNSISLTLERPNLYINFEQIDGNETSIDLNLVVCPLSLSIIGMKPKITTDASLLSFETFNIKCSTIDFISGAGTPSLIASKFGGNMAVRKLFSSITVRSELIISDDYLQNDLDLILPKSIMISVPATINSITVTESGLSIPNSKFTNIPVGGICFYDPSNSTLNATKSSIDRVYVYSNQTGRVNLFGLPSNCVVKAEVDAELSLFVDTPVPFTASGRGKIIMDNETAKNADPAASSAFVEISLSDYRTVVLSDDFFSIDGIKYNIGAGGLQLVATNGCVISMYITATNRIPPVKINLKAYSGVILRKGFKSFSGNGTLDIIGEGHVSIRSMEKPPISCVRVLLPTGSELSSNDVISPYKEMWSATSVSIAYVVGFALLLIAILFGIAMLFFTPLGKQLNLPTFGPFADVQF